jgi:hypothetical protein
MRSDLFQRSKKTVSTFSILSHSLNLHLETYHTSFSQCLYTVTAFCGGTLKVSGHVWIVHPCSPANANVHTHIPHYLITSPLLFYTGCNWKVRTNFGHEIHIPKQEKLSISTYVRKDLMCVIAERILSWPISRAVRDVLNNAYHDRCAGRRGPTAWSPLSPDLIFTCGAT